MFAAFTFYEHMVHIKQITYSIPHQEPLNHCKTEDQNGTTQTLKVHRQISARARWIVGHESGPQLHQQISPRTAVTQ